MTLVDFFIDPVLRSPTIGTMLMSISASLIGVLLLLNKRSLIAETLSHAAYPGVVFSLLFAGVFFPSYEKWHLLFMVLGAFIFSFLALKMISYLERAQNVKPDAALCFVLALFFGVGIVATSGMQSIVPKMQKQVQMLLFGQAATMTDFHIYLYGFLAVLVGAIFFSIYPSLQATAFDREFAKSANISVKFVEGICFWVLLTSLILGIRCVGVVLMSAMVIAPAVAARQWTDSLSRMLFIATIFGVISSFLGNVSSVLGTIYLSSATQKVALATGPMIVIFGTIFAVFSMLFAPKKGLFFQKIRVGFFYVKCLEENILKTMWKKKELDHFQMRQLFSVNYVVFKYVMRRLIGHGWVNKNQKKYQLTSDGFAKASSIVRLHRLWELYLANMLKLDERKIHKTAEEMEHILTPEIEKVLTQVLKNPKKDPHQQPIPEKVL